MGQVRVKICGITNYADAVVAERLGAHALGFNFYRPSPRYVAPSAAALILRDVSPFIEPVALFVNEALPAIFETLVAMGFVRTFQWHGDKPALPSASAFHFIPAFAVKDESGLESVKQYLAACREAGMLPSGILIDGHHPNLYGGTGQPAPWRLLADFDAGVPLILAGGLTPDNVAEAIHIVRPYAVDVAGGVESSPGKKDAEKMRRFIDQACEAAARL